MAFPRPRPRHSGTAQDAHVQHHVSSHFASYVTEGDYAQHHTTSHEDFLQQRINETGRYPNDRQYPTNNSRSGPDRGSNYSNRQDDTGPGYLDCQKVLRVWETRNPEVQRMLNDPNLRDAIALLERQSNHTHRCSSARQPRPTPNEHHHLQHQAFNRYESNSRPLGMSNLRNLNERRPMTRPIDDRFHEDQRAGPYDAVGCVESQPDYESQENEGYEQPEGYGVYEEMDYDDRSSTIFC